MAKVTDVRIRRIYDEGKVKAILSATLDNSYVIHGIKILENENGYFIAMPSKKLKEGEFKDIFHPINSEARQILQNEIMSFYNSYLKNEESKKDIKKEEYQKEDNLEQTIESDSYSENEESKKDIKKEEYQKEDNLEQTIDSEKN